MRYLLTAAVGENSKEFLFGSAAAFTGYLATNYLGGWDKAIKVLLILMVADYITGLLGAIRTKTVNSEVMFWGGIRKAIVLLVIAIAALSDQFVGGNAPVFRTLALYFYAGREGLSVVENFGILGVPLPGALTKFLEQLQEKGANQDGKEL